MRVELRVRVRVRVRLRQRTLACVLPPPTTSAPYGMGGAAARDGVGRLERGDVAYSRVLG